MPLKNRQDLSTVYTPGVARVSMAIAADPSKAFQLTIKRNMVAVVTDGTAVLGLGDIGPLGALPVMEGKVMLFRQFAEIDAFPICLDTKDVDAIVETVVRIAPVFGGINLEDISAPRCFEVEERLIEALDIPVMHDDQHGTAVVILARPDQRRSRRRQTSGGSQHRRLGQRRGRHGDDQDAAGRRGARRHSGRSQRRAQSRRPLRQPAVALAGGALQSREPARDAGRRSGRHRRLHRGFGAGNFATGAHRADGARSDRLCDGESDAGDHARRGRAGRRGRRDGPIRLSQSGQQSARVSRNLPGCARRARAANHRTDEAGRGLRNRRHRERERSAVRSTSFRASSTHASSMRSRKRLPPPRSKTALRAARS